MKTWIVSSLDVETIQGEETIQGRKLYEEIGRYMKFLVVSSISSPELCFNISAASSPQFIRRRHLATWNGLKC